MVISGEEDPAKYWLIDDSLLNIRGAKREGWNSYLFDEDSSYAGQIRDGDTDAVLSSLQGASDLRPFVPLLISFADLRKVWKQHFKQQ